MLGLLCGGQGLVGPDMFALAEDEPAAQEVFAAAADLLGADPRALVRAPADFSRNRTSQLLSVTAALANFAVLALSGPFLVTGYSVGEMASWCIAGVWTPAEALRLTARRAEAMDAASRIPGRLAYVRGLPQAQVAALAAAHACAIAIINPGDLFVVGGPEAAMAGFCAAARAAGAVRAELLAVHVAAHTPHLAGAVKPFETALQESAYSQPAGGRQLLAGNNGERVFRAQSGLAALAGQIATPINWAATLDSLAERGATKLLDLGPGNALHRTAAPLGLPGHAASDFRTATGLRDWLRSANAN